MWLGMRSSRLTGAAAWAFTACVLVCSARASADDSTPHPTSRFVNSRAELATTSLRLRRTVQATILGPDVHRYSLRLNRGQFAAVNIDQTDGNLVAVVFDSAGEILDIVDDNGAGMREVATIVANRTGDYFIQVAVFEWDTPSVSYAIEFARRERAQRTPEARAAQLFSSWYARDAPGAALAVVRNGRVAFSAAIGMADVARHVPITVHTPLDVASVSKQFTAYAVALLIDRGIVSLHDDVRTYVPELHDYGTTITVRHLLEHTSGLKDWDGLFALSGRGIEDGISVDDVLTMVSRQTELNFEPGRQRRYSNTGYVLLAVIVERVTGKRFDAWTADNLFAPLGMNECRFARMRHPAQSMQVMSYRSRVPSPRVASGQRLITMGSSALECSVSDLAIWLDNYRTGRLGGPSVRRMVSDSLDVPTGLPASYVFGNWHGDREGVPYVGHQGLAAGFRASVRSFPSHGLAVIYLSNDGNDATFRRATAIEDLFLGKAPRIAEVPAVNFTPATRLSLDIADINDYVGRYVSAELKTTYDIARHGDGIAAVHSIVGTVPLTPQGDDRFGSDKGFLPSLVFVREPTGGVSGFRVVSEDVGSLLFSRAEAGASSRTP